MDAARWARVQALFHAAIERPDAERAAFVEREAAGDAALVAEVTALLEQDARGDSLLHRTLGGVAHDALAAPADWPRALGPYRLHEALGEGGMGVVFRAERTDVGSTVAIKFLRDAWLSPARRALFAREQRALARLNHPNIARLYDADALPDGTPWFAMEYVDGLPLTRWCEERRSGVRDRVKLFRGVCEAVLDAHQQALLHRDLKPSNILVTRGGQPKLLDFGIAKPMDAGDAPADGTRTVLRAFTPAYAAPEQFRGDAVDVRSDLYSLGAVLYELLTGRPPVDVTGLGAAEAERRVAERVPDPPSSLARPEHRHERGVAWADLDVLCAKALHKAPARRYASVDALIRDLDHWLAGEALDARPDAWTYRAGKFVGRHRGAVAAVAAGVVIVTSLVGYYTVSLSRARDVALAEAERTRRIQSFMNSLFEGGDGDAGPSDTLRVVTLLDRGEHEAAALGREPVIQAELFQTLGGIQQALGRFDRAESLQVHAHAIRRAGLPPDHPDVARSLMALATLRTDQSRYAEAESLGRGALAIARTHARTDPALAAQATSALGYVLVNAGEYDESIATLREAVVLDSLANRPPTDRTATLTLLANAYFYAGQYTLADSLNRRVLEQDLAMHGPRHPRVASDQINLGAVRQELGDWKGALAHYRQALEIYRGWYGEDHFETAAAINMVGRALVQVGDRAEGERMLRRALAVRERLYGPMHTSVASTLNEIGVLAQYEERWAEAEAALRRMREIYEQIYGGRHYLIGLSIANLGSLHTAQGDDRGAEALYREALVRYGQVLDESHPYVGVTRIKLGRALLRQKRVAEAERETRAGYEIVAKQAEPMLGFLQNARRDLAREYEALGRPADAQRFWKEAAAAAADSAKAAAES